MACSILTASGLWIIQRGSGLYRAVANVVEAVNIRAIATMHDRSWVAVQMDRERGRPVASGGVERFRQMTAFAFGEDAKSGAYGAVKTTGMAFLQRRTVLLTFWRLCL